MERRTIVAIKDFIDTAEKSLKNAKKLLNEVLKAEWIELKDITMDTAGLTTYSSDDNKIIEWVFTWEDMLWADGNRYPVPVNYASKSKLVQWDKLKLTIDQSWKMLYKQILPIPRDTKIGILVQENGKFQVIVEWQTYNLLTAAVTHFKCAIGDQISVLLPSGKQATFAAIEALLPKQ